MVQDGGSRVLPVKKVGNRHSDSLSPQVTEPLILGRSRCPPKYLYSSALVTVAMWLILATEYLGQSLGQDFQEASLRELTLQRSGLFLSSFLLPPNWNVDTMASIELPSCDCGNQSQNKLEFQMFPCSCPTRPGQDFPPPDFYRRQQTLISFDDFLVFGPYFRLLNLVLPETIGVCDQMCDTAINKMYLSLSQFLTQES